MRLKVDKYTFLASIYTLVYSEVDAALKYGSTGSTSLESMISKAVAQGVQTAIKELIEAQYTNSDFENDIGLK